MSMSPPEPHYFGDASRPLFGWLHRGVASVDVRPVAIVLCAPMGSECTASYRSLRHLAQRCSALGFTVLRFDYDGLGDSAGDELDPDRWATWQRSVGLAIDFAREQSGASLAVLVGLRLGATLATLAAATRTDVTGLVGVAPVVSGRAWLREVRALQAAMGLADAPAEHALAADVTENVGLTLAAPTRSAIEMVDLATMQLGPSTAVLIVDRSDRPGAAKWHTALATAGADVEYETLPGYVEMMRDPHEAVVPERIIERITEWVERRFPLGGHPRATPTRAAARRQAPVSERLEEHAIHLDDAGQLFGIVSKRTGASPDRALLLLNSGAIPHHGNGRLYVKLARRFAEAGWLVLRYDVSGIGDSLPHAGGTENDVYSARGVEDLRIAVNCVRSRYAIRHVELAGLCSGAFHGLTGAMHGVEIQGINAINPLVFYWKAGMSLAAPSYQSVRAAEQYRRSMFEWAKWLKLLSGKVSLRPIVETARARFRAQLDALLRNLRRTIGLPMREDLGTALRDITARGTRVRFIFSAGDPGVALLQASAGWALTPLLDRRLVSIVTLADCDHSLNSAWMHHAMWVSLAQALEVSLPMSGAATGSAGGPLVPPLEALRST